MADKFQNNLMETSRIRSVSVRQVIVVETQIGNGEETALRPFIHIFEMNGTEAKIGDWTKS